MKLSWRGANFLFLACQATQSAAEGHLSAFTPLLLHDLGLTAAEVAAWTGLLVGIQMAVATPLAPFWGVLAERYSRRPIILRGYVLLAAALFIAAWAEDVRWLIVARLLMGLCSGAGGVIMATQAMITPANRLGTAIATVQAAQPIAASLGPPLGALAIPFIGLRGLLMIDSGATLGAALALALLLPEPSSRVKRGSVLGRTGEVLGFVWKTPPIRWNFLSSFLMRGATSVVDAYLPVRITQLATDPATAIGWILGIYGLLTTIATWLVGRVIDRTEAAVLYWRAMLFATVVTIGMALSPSIWLLGLLAALRSIPVACSNTVLYAHAARVLPPGEQTSVFALSPVPRNAAQSIFPVLAALVASLAPGAALILGAISYGATFLSGLYLVVVTRAAPAPTVAPRESDAEAIDSAPI
jgi:MFS transporter, DHA1 family, multidrug resistance protein